MEDQAVEKSSIGVLPPFCPKRTRKDGVSHALKQGKMLLYDVVLRHLSTFQSPYGDPRNQSPVARRVCPVNQRPTSALPGMKTKSNIIWATEDMKRIDNLLGNTATNNRKPHRTSFSLILTVIFSTISFPACLTTKRMPLSPAGIGPGWIAGSSVPLRSLMGARANSL